MEFPNPFATSADGQQQPHRPPSFTRDVNQLPHQQQQQSSPQPQLQQHQYASDAQTQQHTFSTNAQYLPRQHDSFANLTNPATASSSNEQAAQRANDPQAQRAGDPQFDIFEWYPKYQSCQRYFVDHAQQSGHVQAVAAFVNIHLPFQNSSNPIEGSSPRLPPGALMGRPNPPPHQAYTSVSLVPYLRRLVVTGLDFPGILHGFFGDDWASGVGPLHEQERRNYLFAAKSGGWASVKKDYDMLPLETVPFMRPLQGPIIAEIEAAEKSWSEWLAMEDWMVGPRAPDSMDAVGGQGRDRDTGQGEN